MHADAVDALAAAAVGADPHHAASQRQPAAAGHAQFELDAEAVATVDALGFTDTITGSALDVAETVRQCIDIYKRYLP